jgi:hypothetical protein
MHTQVALNVSGQGLLHAPLSGEVFDAAEANVTRWTVAEAVKAATAKAKNDLETYIINTREKLEINEQYQEVSGLGVLALFWTCVCSGPCLYSGFGQAG